MVPAMLAAPGSPTGPAGLGLPYCARIAAAIASACGLIISTVAPGTKIVPLQGTASTTITLPTSCGPRAAIISPVNPPSESPTTPGAGRPAGVEDRKGGGQGKRG